WLSDDPLESQGAELILLNELQRLQRACARTDLLIERLEVAPVLEPERDKAAHAGHVCRVNRVVIHLGQVGVQDAVTVAWHFPSSVARLVARTQLLDVGVELVTELRSVGHAVQ